MDTAKWPQDFIVKPMNEIVTNTCLKQPNPSSSTFSQVERKTRPERDQALNCPRCNSLNTKFCYYNNYSLTQPRYFCKDCRRYWTEGGSLRNIPIGGGIRKNKRSSSSSSSSKKSLFVNNTPQLLNPKVDEAKAQDLVFSQGFVNAHEVKDLNLAFSQGFGISTHHHHHHNNTLVSTSSALELLGISNTSSTSSSNTRPAFLPYPSHVQDPSVYTAAAAAAAEASGGFGMSYPQFQEFMRTPSSLGFSLDGGFGGDTLHQEEGSSNARPLFPFESLKVQVSSSSNNSGGKDNHSDNEQHERGGREEGEGEGEAEQSVGFWNGMLGNGASAPTGNNNGSWQ